MLRMYYVYMALTVWPLAQPKDPLHLCCVLLDSKQIIYDTVAAHLSPSYFARDNQGRNAEELLQ